MNAKQRKEINNLISKMEEIAYLIDEIKQEEEEKFDNLPDGLQGSEIGEAMSNAVEYLQSAQDSTEEVIENLQNAIGG